MTDTSTAADAAERTAATVHGSDMTVERYLWLKGQHRRAKEAQGAANKALNRVRQEMENQGIVLKVFDQIEDAEKENAQTTYGNLELFKQYAGFERLSIARHMSLSKSPKPVAVSETGEPYADGYRRGLQGLGTDPQRFAPLTPEGGEHESGYTAGLSKAKEIAREIDLSPRGPGRPPSKKAGDVIPLKPVAH